MAWDTIAAPSGAADQRNINWEPASVDRYKSGARSGASEKAKNEE